jgi:cobyrinic acid a,c-diamide synthase
MSLVIAGERSGVGKTTITLAILAALRHWGVTAQSFKVGPDYIDPMFHHAVTGRVCRNLDPVLTSEAYIQRCFVRHCQNTSVSIVEGVMGLFDGAAGEDDVASTAHVARLLNLPLALVIDCSRLSRSVAAIAHGYRTLDPRLQLAGVILNRVGSDRHLELLKSALEPLNIPILGVIYRQDAITIPDRHLGLVPTDELPNLTALIDRLAILGQASFDWLQLMPLLTIQANLCDPFTGEATPTPIAPQLPFPLRIAVASDPAFNFYYADNLELLQALGAELIHWSPLHDPHLPTSIHGLYFGGGFPEMMAEALAANQSAQNDVRSALHVGMPTYAECGGLMYLCQQIVDFDERAWPMVGIFPTTAHMQSRLTLGYRQATSLQNSPLVAMGDQVWGHEFHRSRLTSHSQNPLYQIHGYRSSHFTQKEGWRWHKVHASYVHLHWGARPDLPARFLAHCARFAEGMETGCSINP